MLRPNFFFFFNLEGKRVLIFLRVSSSNSDLCSNLSQTDRGSNYRYSFYRVSSSKVSVQRMSQVEWLHSVERQRQTRRNARARVTCLWMRIYLPYIYFIGIFCAVPTPRSCVRDDPRNKRLWLLA